MRVGICAAFSALVLAGCGESVMIHSIPVGANVYVNDKFLGRTPVEFEVSRFDVSSADYRLRIEKDRFEPVRDIIRTRLAPGRMVGALFTIGIVYIFRSPVYLVPVPTYALNPLLSAQPLPERDRAIGEALRHLQELHDQGKLTDEEWNRRRDLLLRAP